MNNGYLTGTDVVSGRLYHYEKFCPKWLENTLRNEEIHCSDPAKLNDPWDCRVSLNCPISEDRIRNSDEEVTRTVEWFSGYLTKELQQRRIYCLTPDPLSTLMWSHYGGEHTGICLEFHVGNLLFVAAHGVQYRERYPAFAIARMDSRSVMEVILTKAKCWEYEEEYRLIGSPKHPDGNPLKLHGDFLKLPDRSLLSVIVGCNGDYKHVKAIVDMFTPGVRVIQVRRAPNQYNLMMGLP
jgi:hypothetical protein